MAYTYEDAQAFCCVECEYYKCEENRDRLDNAKEWLESIVKRLYTQAPLDELALENDLDELCHVLKVKMHPGDLQIERKRPIDQVLNNWINFNTQFTKLKEKI